MKKATATNIHNVEVGDTITFTNKSNYKVVINITRVEEKSCYNNFGGRESWGTINRYLSYPDAQLIKSNK